MKTACFFVRTKDPSQLQTVEFYAQDIRFLRELGYDVRPATRLRDIRVADLFFCWWWTWALFPVMLARLLGRPSVITGTFNHHLYQDRPLHQRIMIALAARLAFANVFVSQLERGRVCAMLKVRNPSTSPHTVDVRAYRPGDAGRDPSRLLMVVHMDGGNSDRKCVAESIRAVATLSRKLPDIRLVVAGEKGSDHPALAALASALGIPDKVTFPGRVTREEKIRLMQTCAIYLQPSRFEGFGLAGLEAMSCGAAVITSPVGAVPEVGSDAVVYVDGTNSDAIARSIADLVENPELRNDLGRRARERAVAHFAPERRLADLARVLADVHRDTGRRRLPAALDGAT